VVAFPEDESERGDEPAPEPVELPALTLTPSLTPDYGRTPEPLPEVDNIERVQQAPASPKDLVRQSSFVAYADQTEADRLDSDGDAAGTGTTEVGGIAKNLLLGGSLAVVVVALAALGLAGLIWSGVVLPADARHQLGMSPEPEAEVPQLADATAPAPPVIEPAKPPETEAAIDPTTGRALSVPVRSGMKGTRLDAIQGP